MKPDFDLAVRNHLEAIENRDLEAFKSHLTKNEKLYTIVQNGHAFTTPRELADVHAMWFQDPDWIWKGTVVHKVVGQDMAMTVIRYNYRANPRDAPVETWLTYVFALEDGDWKIVHDQNTALDFHAFERALNQNAQ